MRAFAVLCLSAFVCLPAQAQDQERGLIDRLLRPNMELRNPAQGKAFTTDSKIASRQANARTFSVQSSAKQKEFADTRVVTAGQFSGRRTNQLGTGFVQTANAGTPAQIKAGSVRDGSVAYDAHTELSGRRFAGDRSFRDQGKSQKSLDRHNPPLTIDQVRELLNKNK